MTNKNRYFHVLAKNNGRLNEIILGERIGLSESETREIIVQLLSEYRIEYVENRFCNYGIIKKKRRNNHAKPNK